MTENSNCYGNLPLDWVDYWQKEAPVAFHLNGTTLTSYMPRFQGKQKSPKKT